MQNLLLDCKNIFIAYNNMLVGAESIGIVVELEFNALQQFLVMFSAVSSPFFCECLNISLSHQ